MMKRKLLLFLALAAVGYFLTRPTLFVFSADKTLYESANAEGEEIVIKFIHSVQKTPVEEYLRVQQGGFLLTSTRYRSFGVGLPFLAEEGNFRSEGDSFVMDDMNRRYETISLRTGTGTKLTLVTAAGEVRLYEILPLGCRVNLCVAPYYEKLRRRMIKT